MPSDDIWRVYKESEASSEIGSFSSLTNTLDYHTTDVIRDESGTISRLEIGRRSIGFRTDLTVPKLGVMIVGIAGNNGTTLAAALSANKQKCSWETEHGLKTANWLGSIAMSGTFKLGSDSKTGADVYHPISGLLPMVNPDDIILAGWDIAHDSVVKGMQSASVIPLALQKLVAHDLSRIHVYPGIYRKEFIAENQHDRARHVLQRPGTWGTLVEIKANINEFREKHKLDKIIVFWSANTEKMSPPDRKFDTKAGFEKAITSDFPIAPSMLYAYAALWAGCSFINGSPQNTFCPGLVECAAEFGGHLLAGDDLKTGQTKFKSVMVDFLIASGLKPTSIVSYNHLGNNDGLNLSSAEQFRSKEISKSSVIDDMVASNPIIFPVAESHPDHLVVIKYVPSVGDSKRAMDEYSADICLNGKQTFVVHNTCEDSLLAAPIMLDLILFMELLQRIEVAKDGQKYLKPDTMVSLLSFFLKAPAVPSGQPVNNAFFAQRQALIDFLRAAAGLPPTDFINLESRYARK